MKEFALPIRIYYEDTDAGGIVYHANYLKYMERARMEWLRKLGFELTDLMQQYNLVLVVRKIAIDYFKPALFNEALDVTVKLNKLGKASMTLQQQVVRQSDILCMAQVRIAAINVVNMRPQPYPATLFSALQEINP
ncbi:MAG: tol-pal system-associated acyl-CoA thioesterase [Thioploca sp.]|nr:tol-pal system-associated acyl-CoA thioesterase [Thioploca sp.]